MYQVQAGPIHFFIISIKVLLRTYTKRLAYYIVTIPPSYNPQSHRASADYKYNNNINRSRGVSNNKRKSITIIDNVRNTFCVHGHINIFQIRLQIATEVRQTFANCCLDAAPIQIVQGRVFLLRQVCLQCYRPSCHINATSTKFIRFTVE